jgi:hypothetical protein
MHNSRSFVGTPTSSGRPTTIIGRNRVLQVSERTVSGARGRREHDRGIGRSQDGAKSALIAVPNLTPSFCSCTCTQRFLLTPYQTTSHSPQTQDAGARTNAPCANRIWVPSSSHPSRRPTSRIFALMSPRDLIRGTVAWSSAARGDVPHCGYSRHGCERVRGLRTGRISNRVVIYTICIADTRSHCPSVTVCANMIRSACAPRVVTVRFTHAAAAMLAVLLTRPRGFCPPTSRP